MQSLRQVSQYIFMKTWVSFHKRRNGGRGIQQLFCGNNDCVVNYYLISGLLQKSHSQTQQCSFSLFSVLSAPALTTTTTYIFKLVNRSDITGEGGEQGSGMDGWKGVGLNGLDEHKYLNGDGCCDGKEANRPSERLQSPNYCIS